MPRLLLAAGGTGGHMFPAQALSETLKSQGWDIAMITDARGRKHTGRIQADPILDVPAASISPRKPIAAIKGAFALWKGVRKARAFIKDWQPDIVVGFGGYPAFPALRAAQEIGLPTILHEQNAVLGRVNRVFAAKAQAVASGFEALSKCPDGTHHIVIGNPLRDAVRQAIPPHYTAPKTGGPIHILIVGGSLGARIISDVVPQAIANLPNDLRTRLNIVQQTRQAQIDTARTVYTNAGIDAHLDHFFTDIETHLAEAHIVIGRAGASSVSEIAAMGKPSILIPLGIAMDDHQTANALSLARHGAAEIMPESAFTPEALARSLQDKLNDSTWLETAAASARAHGRPDAAHDLAQLVIDTVQGSSHERS